MVDERRRWWFYVMTEICDSNGEREVSLLMAVFGDGGSLKNGPWLSVPPFGESDQKGQVPDYSLDFSKIRETRKQNKTNISRASLGNEEEFINSTTSSLNTAHTTEHHHPRHYNQTHSPNNCETALSELQSKHSEEDFIHYKKMEPENIDWDNIDPTFIEDEAYENFDALKWVDLSSSNELLDIDDEAWF